MEFVDYLEQKQIVIPKVSTFSQSFKKQYSQRKLKNTLGGYELPYVEAARARSVTKIQTARKTSQSQENLVNSLLKYNCDNPGKTQKLNTIMKTLEQILSYELKLPGQTSKLIDDIRQFIYADIEMLNYWRVNLVDQVEGKLKRLLLNNDEQNRQVPLVEVCKALGKCLIKQIEKLKESQSIIDKQAVQLLVARQRYNQQMKQLTGELSIANKDLEKMKTYESNQPLNEILEQVRDSQSSLLQQNQILRIENQDLLKQNSSLSKTIREQNINQERFNEDYKQKSEEMDKYIKHFRTLQFQFKSYKDMFDKGLYKILLLRNDLKSLQQKVNLLQEENQTLKRKVSSTQEELTPRPNHQQIFAKINLDYENIFPNALSTEKVEIWLADQIEKLFQSAATLSQSKRLWEGQVSDEADKYQINDMVKIKDEFKKIVIDAPTHNMFK